MTQSSLNRAVARATGETLGTIKRRGFSMLEPTHDDADDEPYTGSVRLVDWDRLDEARVGLFPGRETSRLAA